MNTLEKLREIQKLIGQNNIEAYNHDLSETSASVVLEDIEVCGDGDETNTVKYNGWYEQLEELIQVLENPNKGYKLNRHEEGKCYGVSSIGFKKLKVRALALYEWGIIGEGYNADGEFSRNAIFCNGKNSDSYELSASQSKELEERITNEY